MNESPESGSVVDNVPTVVPAGWFSATVLLESAIPVGGAFGGGGGVPLFTLVRRADARQLFRSFDSRTTCVASAHAITNHTPVPVAVGMRTRQVWRATFPALSAGTSHAGLSATSPLSLRAFRDRYTCV